MGTNFYSASGNVEKQVSSNELPELFMRHNDTVLCCSIDSKCRLAVSGGIDDTAFVWDLNTKHVIFECMGHKESVVAAAFSVGSTYVATGDLNGYIQVRNTTTGIKVFDFEIDEINWIIWHNNSEYVVLAGTKKGDFWMWNVNDPAAIKTFPSFGSSSTAARLLPDGMKIIVTYQDGSAKMFDLKSKQTLFQYSDPNKSEIISLDLSPSKDIFAIGFIDSCLKLFTIGNFRSIGSLTCKTPKKNEDSTSEHQIDCMDQDEDSHSDEFDGDKLGNLDQMNLVNSEPLEVVDEYTDNKDNAVDAEHEEEDADLDGDESDYDGEDMVFAESVESVLFSPCGDYLAASNNSGSIYIWDVNTLATRCELHTGIGITRCAWSDKSHYITACLDGKIRVYDLNLKVLNEISAHQDQVLDLAYKDGVLVSASEDKTCRSVKL